MSDPGDRLIDSGDRLIDYALREAYGSEAPGADLSVVVREAWERGERRPAPRIATRTEVRQKARDGLRASERGTPDHARPTAARRPRRGDRAQQNPWVLTAAASLLVAGGLLVLHLTDSTAETDAPGLSEDADLIALVATSDRPLRSLHDGGSTVEVTLGQDMVVPIGGPARIEFPDGGGFVAAEGARFSLESFASLASAAPRGNRLTLTGGSLEIAAGSSAVDVRLSAGGVVSVAALGSANVQFQIDPEGGSHGAVKLWARAGKLTLRGAAVPPTDLAVRDAPAIFLLADGQLRAAAQRELSIHEEFLVFAEDGASPAMRIEQILASYGEGGLAELRAAPELWPLAMESAQALLGNPDVPSFVRSQVVNALAIDQSGFAGQVVRQAWIDSPAAFTTDAIVAMAERGYFEFEREVQAWYQFAEPEPAGASSAAAGGESAASSFAIAMYLAQRGDDRGRQEIERVAGASNPDAPYDRLIVAAAGLALLGDDAVWREALDKYAASTLKSIESGVLEDAFARVDALAYAVAIRRGDGLRGSAAPLRVGVLDHWIGTYSDARLSDGRSLAELEDELDRLIRSD